MGILQIIAEERLGKTIFADHSRLKARLRKIEKATENRPAAHTSAGEKQRIAAIVELCFEYEREKDSDERKNILRTLDEIAADDPVRLPTETIEKWNYRVAASDAAYAALNRKGEQHIQEFLRKYFLLRAQAGLKTQADVAKRAGLSRTYVTVLESGAHAPQQKTLQKLAKAFGVKVTDLM